MMYIHVQHATNKYYVNVISVLSAMMVVFISTLPLQYPDYTLLCSFADAKGDWCSG